MMPPSTTSTFFLTACSHAANRACNTGNEEKPLATDLEKLLNFLEVEQIDKYLFIGKSPKKPTRVFGGQVLAQALNSAIRTVDADRVAHSMHAYFLRPGDPNKQIVYEVDPIRDGRSFTTRRVVAKQDGAAIFNTTVSFQVEEQGFSHQTDMAEIPTPEELQSDHDFWLQMSAAHPDKFESSKVQPIERKTVQHRDYLNPQPQDPRQQIWFRALGDLGDDRAKHQTVLAYISDNALLSTALLPHPYTGWNENIQMAPC
jgi:acyl-CoA thioesterase-2